MKKRIQSMTQSILGGRPGLILLLALAHLAPSPRLWASGAANDHTVLILETTVTGGAGSLEALAASAHGMDIELVDAAGWAGNAAADFATYRALILGDPTCVEGAGAVAPAEANQTLWSPAITGNIIIIGTDPTFHAPAQAGAATLIDNGIAFVLAQPGKTGLYVALSCYYAGGASQAVPLLAQFGLFMTEGAPGCFNPVHIVATHPALAGLTDPNLSNWSCSVHEDFTLWPADFDVLVMALTGATFTAADGSSGTPYILARGEGLRPIGNFSLTPTFAENPVGTDHTVTVAVTKAALGVLSPVAGVTVTFTVTSGPNAGATGTAVTDASGQATFTYTDAGGVGTDTIVATLVDASGATQTSNEAAKTWSEPPACAHDLSVEVGYEAGGCGDSFLYCADLDSGFVIIKNNGPATFVGELRLDGVAGTGGDVHDTSGPGYTLAPGDSFRLEAGPASRAQGGFNKLTNVCSAGCGTPDDGLLLSISGTAAGLSLSFQILDKDIHSGTFQDNPYGVHLDNYILQGGDSCGRDTGDGFAVNQAHALLHLHGSCLEGCRLTCPGDLTVCNQKGQCGAAVNYAGLNLSGNCADAALACSPASDSFFPVGRTIVHCTASAGAGVVAQCSFAVTVTDNELPTIICPGHLVACNDHGQCGAVLWFAPATTDNCGTNVTVVCSPPAGTKFPIGTTFVTCIVPGNSTNSPTCGFSVTVRDCEAPTMSCPGNMTICTDPGQCTAKLSYTKPTATDNCGAGGAVVCSPPPGAIFSTGTNVTVNCTATDASRNTSRCSFTVMVKDCEPPRITCPANITQCNDSGQCGAVVTFSPSATDNCPGVAFFCSPASGSSFPVGATTVACTAVDKAGNPVTCAFTVTVKDCEPPTVGCSPTTNPAGGNVPNAGAGQGSNPNSGQNPDGFYQLQGTDNCGAAGV
ncbi:MAG: HYR domain-containing protein, partial [Verrucomicrobia bacterium]|nr:HYR domain-containing protein [Verrucomicrobiota bacterium]